MNLSLTEIIGLACSIARVWLFFFSAQIQPSAIHHNLNDIIEGMTWFWVPASLVICNDIFAYVWGKETLLLGLRTDYELSGVTTGRTPLLALSPKKTVEGFVGAIFSTLIFGFFVSVQVIPVRI